MGPVRNATVTKSMPINGYTYFIPRISESRDGVEFLAGRYEDIIVITELTILFQEAGNSFATESLSDTEAMSCSV